MIVPANVDEVVVSGTVEVVALVVVVVASVEAGATLSAADVVVSPDDPHAAATRASASTTRVQRSGLISCLLPTLDPIVSRIGHSARDLSPVPYAIPDTSYVILDT
jgi:hypothetical protein